MRAEAVAVEPPPARRLAESHLPLVQRIALECKRTALTGADVDDLIGWGVVGLMEAAHRFDASRGWAFSTFARHRIRGAMIDGARAALGGGTNHGLLQRVYGLAADEYICENGRSPIGFDEKESADVIDGLSMHVNLATPDDDQEVVVDEPRRARAVRKAVASLPSRERWMVAEADIGDREIGEVGRELGWSKTKATRVRASALAMLRVQLRDVWF